MNVYYRNKKADLSSAEIATETPLTNVYDPALELRADFKSWKATIAGDFGGITAIDSLCLGYTNAVKYRLTTREGECSGFIRNRIEAHNFEETIFTDWFTLELNPYAEWADAPEPGERENLYLGHLFLGMKTALPRFSPGPSAAIALASEASRSFGGQVFGIKRTSLASFSAAFPMIAADERRLIEEYVVAVQNVEPHIIDPYPGARAEFPPMYAALDMGELQMQKIDGDGFFWSCQLAWREAR
ncbi:MAG: hypothetical protein LBI06_07285 [Treponema sp.]|nr:hypothetical protein [Treponema sp.]